MYLYSENSEIYNKIEEMVKYQVKTGTCIEMFEIVMQLDNIYECIFHFKFIRILKMD